MNTFIAFLEKLKTPENEGLISIVESGYNAILEYPHVMTHDDEYTDLYIEKANAKGKKAALGYVSYLIRSILNDEEIDIPDEFLMGGELTKIEHPQEDIEYPPVDVLLKQLEMFKEKLIEEINKD